MFFSATTKCFYPEEALHLYEKAGTLPADLVEVTKDQVDEFMSALAPEGKTIGADIKGMPSWVDFPKPTKAEKEVMERKWRNRELSRADTELLKAEDGDGTGTPESWRTYRKELRRWPENAKFPTKKYRPVAPDAA